MCPSATATVRWIVRPFKSLSSGRSRDVTGADLAYMNRGGVRDSLGRGTVTARHVWNILPFDNTLVAAMVLGKDLPEEATAGRRVDPNRVLPIRDQRLRRGAMARAWDTLQANRMGAPGHALGLGEVTFQRPLNGSATAPLSAFPRAVPARQDITTSR